MRGMVEELLEGIEKKEDNFSEGGQFLPLSVWERKGFDVHSIETKSLPQDISEHPVLGTTYRVRLQSLVRSYTSATQRSKRLRVQQDPSSGVASAPKDPATFNATTLRIGHSTGVAQLATNASGALGSEKGLSTIAKSRVKKCCGTNQVKLRKMIDLFSGTLTQPQVEAAPREIKAALKSFLEDVIKFHDDCSVGTANPDTVMYSAVDLKKVFVFGHVSRSAAFCVGYAAPPPPFAPTHSIDSWCAGRGLGSRACPNKKWITRRCRTSPRNSSSRTTS